MKPLIILGLRGVGKSTACAEVVRLDGSFEAIQIGMFVDRHKVNPSPDLGRNEFFAAMESLVAHFKVISLTKKALLESGDFVIKAEGLFRCNHFHVWEKIDPGGIAVLLASAENVAERRNTDTNKRRKEEDDDIYTIGLHQDLLISCASAVANRLGIPLNVVLTQGHLSDVAHQLMDCVKYTTTEYELVAHLRRRL